MSIINQGKSYTFSDYFELNYPTEDIINELGYEFLLTKLALPQGHVKHSLENLRAMFYKKLPHVSLTSETAKREVMIAPILLELLDEIEVKIDIEYPIYVNERLKGNLDYWIRSSQEFLVVEAKKSDMEKGFTQLAIELIAMDQYVKSNSEEIYGAITVGDLWRFGKLERGSKRIVKDIDAFRVPLDIGDLFRVLVGILSPGTAGP
jgi:hypothetical protein